MFETSTPLRIHWSDRYEIPMSLSSLEIMSRAGNDCRCAGTPIGKG